MAVSIRVQEDGCSVVLMGTGPVPGEELLAAHQQFLDDHLEEFRRCRTWLSDFTGGTTVATDATHMRRLASICGTAAVENSDLVVAVAVSADLAFGLARMWEAYSADTGWETRVFRSAAEARRWLEEVTAK